MWITLYCDASYKKGFGGTWAVWIKCDKGRLVNSGDCPSYVDNSISAEMYAAYEGIKQALKKWDDVEGIQINSDCTTVCRAFWPWSKKIKNASAKFIQERTLKLLKEKEILVRGKHVKGHQKPTTTRAYINGRCDDMAREERLKNEEEKKKKDKEKVVADPDPTENDDVWKRVEEGD